MTRTPDVPAPIAEKRPVSRTFHGIALTDEYGWLRAENWRDVMRAPRKLPRDIRAHLQAENAYAKAWFRPLARLRGTLFREMRGRIKEDDSSVPSKDGPFLYYSRFRDGGEHPLLCRRAVASETETVMLDCDERAKGAAFFQLGGARHSPNHALLAWSCDDKGSEFDTIRVRDLKAGTDLPDIITDTGGGMVWASDSKSFFYVRYDDQHRPRTVHRHVLGTPPSADTLVYTEPDQGFFVGIGRTQSGRYLTIDCHDHETSEVHLIDLDRPESAPVLVAKRETGVEYDVEHHGERLFIRTNADAEDFKIAEAPLTRTERAAWRDLVPHREGVMLVAMLVLARWLVRLERVDGLPRIIARHLATGEEHAVAFDEEAYALSLSGGYEFDTDTVRFVYSSMTTPAETYDYDLATRARVLRKRQEVPSGHDPARYVTRRLYATAADGERVPITILMRRDTPLDGSAPAYVYGYGAYGISIPASFRTNALSLVDRGVVYAIAHVRGGTEKGRRWYRDGKLSRKTNTFDDFTTAVEHLVAAGYTAKGRIVAHGGSAGGMLMGAIADRRPDLFAGIVAEVPFVDVLNTMLDDTLPLTPPEWPEWGNPLADPEAFATIRAYSPYDTVSAKAYPAILAIAGLTDPRVTYWEPAKWVAKVRAATTSRQPVLLHTNMAAGHGGAAGRFQSLKETAMIYAFVLDILGAAATKPR